MRIDVSTVIVCDGIEIQPSKDQPYVNSDGIEIRLLDQVLTLLRNGSESLRHHRGEKLLPLAPHS